MNAKQFWENYRKIIVATLVVITGGIAVYFAFLRNAALMQAVGKLMRILTPFVAGGSIAYVLTPVCNGIDRLLSGALGSMMSRRRAEKLAHSISCLLTLVLLFLGVAAFLWLLIPQLYESIKGVADSVPYYTVEVYQKVRPLMEWLDIGENLTAVDWIKNSRALAQQFVESFKLDSLANIATGLGKSISIVGKSVINALVSIIVAFYCLSSRKQFALQGRKLIYALFSKKRAERVLYRLGFANHTFSSFVSGRILDSAIIGVICFVGCSLLKIAYAPLIAVIVGVTNVIPFFGPYIGGIPCLLLVLLENPIQALYFGIFVLLLQQFDGNILGPRIISSAVGVSSFWVLFSILLFGGLWGVAGMILGTPLFAVLYDILRDWVNSRLTEKGLPTEAWRYQVTNQLEIPPADEQNQSESE